jgi:hypothetical protein
MRITLAAALGLAGPGALRAMPAAAGAAVPPAPWEQLLSDLRRSAHDRLAATAQLSPCSHACELQFNQHLVKCFTMPGSALRTACISQALAELESCVAGCPGVEAVEREPGRGEPPF